MVEPSPHTFDEAQLQIYTLMHRDSYPRFINSPVYRRLLRNDGANTWYVRVVRIEPGFFPTLVPKLIFLCSSSSVFTTHSTVWTHRCRVEIISNYQILVQAIHLFLSCVCVRGWFFSLRFLLLLHHHLLLLLFGRQMPIDIIAAIWIKLFRYLYIFLQSLDIWFFSCARATSDSPSLNCDEFISFSSLVYCCVCVCVYAHLVSFCLSVSLSSL